MQCDKSAARQHSTDEVETFRGGQIKLILILYTTEVFIYVLNTINYLKNIHRDAFVYKAVYSDTMHVPEVSETQ